MKQFRITREKTLVHIETKENSKSEWELRYFCGNLKNDKNPAITINIIDKISELSKNGYQFLDVIELDKARENTKEAKHEDNLIGGSYQIVDRISRSHSDTDVSAIVIGKSVHPETPTPYATWQENSRGYDIGHYFSNEQDAVQDFKERSIGLIDNNLSISLQDKNIAKDTKGSHEEPEMDI